MAGGVCSGLQGDGDLAYCDGENEIKARKKAGRKRLVLCFHNSFARVGRAVPATGICHMAGTARPTKRVKTFCTAFAET